MNKFLFSSIAACVIFLGACSDGQTVTNGFEDSKPTAKVSFMVRDGVSGVGLDSVTVTKLDQDSATAESNADGFASFSKVKIGQYYFQISRPGYATVVVSQVVLDIGNSDAPRVPDLNVNVMLPKSGATVSGRAFYTDITGGIKAAADATVELTLGEVDGFSWPQPVVSVTTDESGYYLFEGLPAGVKYTIEVRQLVVDDIAYSSLGTVTVMGVGAGETKSAPILDMVASGGVMRVMTTNFWEGSELSISDSIYIEFTESANTDKVEPGDISVRATIDGVVKEILVGTSWKNENKTLIIFPISGKWWAETSHNITLSLSSVEGVPLTGFTAGSANFEVSTAVGEVGQASALKFTSPDTTVPDYKETVFTLSWKSAKNAEGYQLWIKTATDSTYLFKTEYSDTSALFTNSGYFDDGKEVSFLVVAFNSKFVADPAKAPSLTLKDGVKPTLSTNEIDDLDLSGNASLTNGTSKPDTLTYTDEIFEVSFSEVMDTTTTPKFTIPTAVASKVSFAWVWIDEETAEIRPVIKANQDATTITEPQTFSVDMSTLKDLAGNSANITSDETTEFVVTFVP